MPLMDARVFSRFFLVVMGIDPLGRGDVGMAESFGDVFHRDIVFSERGSAAMSQAMEPDYLHVVALEELMERACDEVRPHDVPIHGDIDETIMLAVVAVLERFTIFFCMTRRTMVLGLVASCGFRFQRRDTVCPHGVLSEGRLDGYRAF